MDQDSEVDLVLKYIAENIRTEAFEDPSLPSGRHFVPKHKLKDYMTEDRLTKLLDSCHATTSWSAVRGSYLAVFVILLSINKQVYIDHFTNDTRLADVFLPFNKDYKWPTGCDFFDLFDEKQREFCAEDLKHNQLTEMKFDSTTIIPIISREILKSGHGTDSSTYLISIHPDYDLLSEDEINPATPRFFILKSCPIERSKPYRNEVKAYRVLGRYKEISNNIARFHGSWIQGESCNILLEYVNGGTLTDLFRTDPPTEAAAFLKFWDNLVRILEPLCKTHSHANPRSPSEVAIGVHQDIKPDNILISRSVPGSTFDFICKLADLGLAYFSSEDLGSEGREDKRKHSQGRESFGTQKYTAPECFRDERDWVDYQSTRPVDTLKDIWSLGCVFSEAAVWSALGPRGWKDYHEKRMEETNKIAKLSKTAYLGCFHDGDNPLPIVSQMHDRVRKAAHPVVYDILAIVEDMLSPVDLRPDAPTIRRKFQRVVTTARRMSRSEDMFPGPFQVSPDPDETQENHFSCSMSESSMSRPSVMQIFSSYDPLHSKKRLQQISSTTSIERHLPPELPLSESEPELGSFTRTTTFSNESTNFPMQPHPSSSTRRLISGTARRQTFVPMSSRTSESLSIGHSDNFAPLQGDPSTYQRRYSRDLLIRQGTHPTETENLSAISSVDSRPAYQQNLDETRSKNETTELNASVQEVLLWILERKKMKRLKNERKSGKLPIHFPEPVPEFELSILRGRDQIFLIDNSASMMEHRVDVINTFKALAYLVKDLDPDGMDIYFTNDSNELNGRDRKSLINRLEKVKFSGQCNMDMMLTRILDQSSDFKFSSLFRRALGKKKWGISIYVLTNGIWNKPQDSGVGSIPGLIEGMVDNINGRAKLGIQFIQFGDNPVGTERLEKLDNTLVREHNVKKDIIDTTRHDGNVFKMLFGAIDDTWDEKQNEIGKEGKKRGFDSLG